MPVDQECLSRSKPGGILLRKCVLGGFHGELVRGYQVAEPLNILILSVEKRVSVCKLQVGPLIFAKEKTIHRSFRFRKESIRTTKLQDHACRRRIHLEQKVFMGAIISLAL